MWFAKKYRLIAVTAILLVMITGLSLLSFTGVDASDSRRLLVAEVNGEKIFIEEVLDIYEQEKPDYGITEKDENDPQKKDMIRGFKTGILDELIYGRLAIQKAKEAGYAVTGEILEEAKKDFDSIILEIAKQLKSQAKQDTNDDVDYIKTAKEYVDSQLKSKGKTLDENIRIISEQKMVDKFMESLVEDVHATEEYVEEYYYNQLEMQIHDPSWNSNREVQLYILPQVRVKHILVALPKEQQEEYFNLLEDKKEDEAKAYLNDRLKTIYSKALSVLNKAKGGESFEKLIDEYGEDPDMKDNKDGYMVSQDGKFVPEFEDAALELAEGEISGLVPSPYGYHIIKCYEKIPEKTYSLEEKRDEIKQIVDDYKKDEKWHMLLEEWAKDAVIKKYEDRL